MYYEVVVALLAYNGNIMDVDWFMQAPVKWNIDATVSGGYVLNLNNMDAASQTLCV